MGESLLGVFLGVLQFYFDLFIYLGTSLLIFIVAMLVYTPAEANKGGPFHTWLGFLKVGTMDARIVHDAMCRKEAGKLLEPLIFTPQQENAGFLTPQR